MARRNKQQEPSRDEGQVMAFSGPTFRVVCVRCGFYSDFHETKDSAIEAWNHGDGMMPEWDGDISEEMLQDNPDDYPCLF